jgi:hypothetical protein
MGDHVIWFRPQHIRSGERMQFRMQKVGADGVGGLPLQWGASLSGTG